MSGWWARALAVCAALTMMDGPAVALAQGRLSGTPPGVVGDTGVAPVPTPDPVVAEVEGHLIRLADVGDEIRSLPGGGGKNSFEALYPAALRRLVERTAIIIHAQQTIADDPAVHRHVQESADQALEDAYLQQATAARVTEQMLLARYDLEVRGKPGPEEVHGRAILVPTEAAARDIIAKLAAGADFATLARESSTDATAGSGGDLGFVQLGNVTPIVGAVLFALRPGEVTAYPVHTAAGWFVLQAVARRRAPTPGFAQARAELMAECQRDELGAVVKSALVGMDIHLYDMNGHTASPEGAVAGSEDPDATR